MSENAGLTKFSDRSIKLLDDAYNSIEEMRNVANLLLESKLCPTHLYEKGTDGKPDYTKGKTASLIMVAFHGRKLGFDIMTAMQQVVPVNGLMSVKGDGAKSLILNSGKIEPGSWREEKSGSIENEDLVIILTATRSDTKETMSRSFSVAQAKRAGLWITAQQVSGADGWKYKSSAWYKYPERMVQYRALGFLARDLFSDVMSGTYTTEEAADMPADQTLVIDKENGVTLQLPDKTFAEDRSKRTTTRAVDKIADKKFEPVNDTGIQHATIIPEKVDQTLNNKGIQDENEMPFKAEKGSVAYMDGKVVEKDGVPVNPEEDTKPAKLSLATMAEMETSDLLAIVNENAEMIEALDTIPGKNTNKKVREIIFAFSNGTLAEHVVKNTPEETTEPNTAIQTEGRKAIENFESAGPEKKEELIKPEPAELNKHGIAIPEFDKGQERDFKTTKELYQNLNGARPPIGNERYLDLIKDIPEFAKWSNKETFCRYATVQEVVRLLNENNITLR